MTGLVDAYIPTFVLALGMGDILSGMVATVPMLLGAILQLATPWAVQRVGSHRRWVVSCATCQGLSLLVLPWAVAKPAAAFWIVYGAASLYWASSLATAPAWNTWMESLVPRRIRARFFGGRARIVYACLLLGTVAGGSMLEIGKNHGVLLGTFTALFCTAAMCRFASAFFLSCKSEPHAGRLTDQRVGWGEMYSRIRSEASGRLLLYLLAMQVAVQVCSPYFVPYMYSELRLTFLELTALIGLAFVGKFTFLPLWGRIVESVGPRRLLSICGMAVLPLPAFWLVSRSVVYLAVLQFFAGGVWAGYELAMLLMFFEAIPARQRTSLLTVFNLGNAAAMVCGTLVGGSILGLCGTGSGGYMVIFATSALVRVLTLGLLARVPAALPSRARIPELRSATGGLPIQTPASTIEAQFLAGFDGSPRVSTCCTPSAETS